ncbi:MAG: DMT family transporter [Chloroflexia bacterium]|nr:DMT family transporter [Chloroflexia bacterium]
MIPSRRHRLAMWCAAATGIQVGAAIVATRAVVDDIDPVPLTFLRYLVGACVLAPFVSRAGTWRFTARDLPPIAALGLVQFGLLIVLLTVGLKTVPAAPGALVFATSPLFALALGIGLGRERWSAGKAAGIGLALAGLAIVLGPSVARLSGSALGYLAIAGAAGCAAIASVWSRPYVRRYGTLPVSAVAMAVTVAVLAVPALGGGVFNDLAGFSARDVAAVLFLGIGSGIGYVMWLYALKSIAASAVTSYLMLGPVTALLLGALFLDEPLSVWAAVGTVVLAGGLWLTTRPSDAVSGGEVRIR